MTVPGMARRGGPIRVLVADDHPVVRRGLRDILAQDPLMSIVGEAGGAAELVELARSRECDVALVDIAMPGRGGLEALKQLRAEHPRLAVLMLSVHAEDQYAVRALRAGAAGYLTKDRAPEELLNAIRKVAAGGRYVTEALGEQLAQGVGRAAGTRLPHEALSDREFQVLRGLAAGKTVGAIAGELALSTKTITTYRTRLLQKLGLRHNADILRYALEHGLFD